MRWIFLLLAVFVALFVFGCSADLGRLFFRERVGVGDTSGLEGEASGVEFRFLPDAPPDEVFVGEEFLVEVEVANLGEGKFIFDGINRIYFDGISFGDFAARELGCLIEVDGSCKGHGFNLERGDFEPAVRIGKRYSAGGSRVYSFGLRYDPLVLDEQEFNINAKECYSYQTLSNAKVCVSYGRESVGFRGRGCDSFREVGANNQVGPIKVVSVVQSGYKQVDGGIRASFKIKVKDFGGGRSYINFVQEGGEEGIYDCRSVGQSEEGFVFLDGEFLAGWEVIELDCEEGGRVSEFGIENLDSGFIERLGEMGIVKLFNGEGEINCSAFVPEGVGVGLYEENMKIELAYLYAVSESKSFKVRAGN